VLTGDRRQPLRLDADPATLLTVGEDGAVGRNTFRAGNTVELDLAAIKNFKLNERHNIAVLFDLFNFINRRKSSASPSASSKRPASAKRRIPSHRVAASNSRSSIRSEARGSQSGEKLGGAARDFGRLAQERPDNSDHTSSGVDDGVGVFHRDAADGDERET